jgi:DNA ligase (NAD+)
MNITGLGPKQIEKLLDCDIIKTYADLYKLKIEDLLKVEKIKNKSAQNIIDSINQSKTVTFDKFIFSIGIYGIGQTNSKSLAKKFNSITELISAKPEELEKISDIGPILAKNIFEYFDNEENKLEIQELINLGIKIIFNHVDQSSQYNQKQIVITGTFNQIKRNEIKIFFEANGAITKNSVSKKTDYLIVGNNPGSKLAKADELNITIINENQLLEIMEE